MVSPPSLRAPAATALALALAAAAAAPASGAGRPNFVVMQPDDLPFFEEWSPPAHLYGRTDGAVAFPDSGMPHLDRMIAGGLTMGQAYAASSMCGTSRYR